MPVKTQQQLNWDEFVNELTASGTMTEYQVVTKAIKLLKMQIDNFEYTNIGEVLPHYDSLDYLESKLNA